MTFNVAWECSNPQDTADGGALRKAERYSEAHEFYWNKLFRDQAAARASIEALRVIRRTGSSLVSANTSREIAQLFIDGVKSWR
jgi:hypothetical protein